MDISLKNHLDNWLQKQQEEVQNNSGSGSYLDKYGKSKGLKKIDLANSFTRDGWLDEEKWENGSKILFILKEANIQEQLDKETEPGKVCADKNCKFTDDFWFKHCVLEGDISWRRGIFRRLQKIGVELSGDSKLDLATTAYMNINKRGGMKNAREDIIADYYKEYANEILEEIRILKPRFVAICCGYQEYAKNLKTAINEQLGNDVEVKMYYHPAVRKKGITDAEYIKGIEC